MALGKNILANIAGRIWSIISIYLFVPIYMNLLGVESYGVITFYTMLLTVLAFADAGLTATLNREFAREVNDNPQYKQNLLRTFEYTYLIIGIFIIGLIYILAPTIVTHFVKSEIIPFNELVWHIRTMGSIIAFYLVSSLYCGGLMGLQKQVLSNILLIGYGIVRSGLVIIPLIWIRDLNLYFYWQLGATIVYFLVLRYYLLKEVRVVGTTIHPNFKYFKAIWKYAAGMMAMAIIYSINTQIDKMSVSNLLSLEYFTYYSLAAMVGQAVLIMATPIGQAFFPELTRQISLSEVDSYKRFYHKFSFIIAALTSSLAVIIVCYSYDYVLIWTTKPNIADAISITTKLLTLGSMFMSIQLCPFYLALANGHTRTNVTMGIITIVFVVPLLLVLIPEFGLKGAAIPWLVVNFSVTTLLGYIVMKKFMKGEFKYWFWSDSLLPIFISFGVGIPLYYLFLLLPAGYYTLLYGLAIFLIVLGFNFWLFVRKFPEIKTHPLYVKLIRI